MEEISKRVYIWILLPSSLLYLIFISNIYRNLMKMKDIGSSLIFISLIFLLFYIKKYKKFEKRDDVKFYKEIIDILKDIHKSKCQPYDWTDYIKSQIQDYYKKTKKYFSIEEQELIEQSFAKYDKYLKDSKFAFIHNDLHFDNIIKNDEGLYLIDFNDAMIAPIDYEFRLLTRFDNNELKENVVNYARKILN